MLARAADEGEARVRLRAPETPPRCTACAFTKGTPANNTLETALDAFGCTLEDVPFMCHQHFDDDGRPVNLCSGWLFARESRTALQTSASGTSPSPVPAREPAARDDIEQGGSVTQQIDLRDEGR